MDPVDEQEVQNKAVNIEITKKHLGINKVLLFDLDETLAHCVR